MYLVVYTPLQSPIIKDRCIVLPNEHTKPESLPMSPRVPAVMAEAFGAHGPSMSVWIIPGTDPEDPEYERSYAMERYQRAHRWQYWLGNYPRAA